MTMQEPTVNPQQPLTISGMLGLSNSDRLLVEKVGWGVTFEAIRELTARFNAEMNNATALFVRGDTTDYSLSYKYSGGGRSQRINRRQRAEEIQVRGAITVQFPLESFGDSLGGTRVDRAYMTMSDLDKAMQTMMQRHTNRVRHEIISAVMDNNGWAFHDEIRGDLVVKGLANGDGDYYPPLHGTEAHITSHSHYLNTGYAVASISDANDPIIDVVNHLEEHFGYFTGGSNIVALVPADVAEELLKLEAVTPVQDRYIVPGANTAVPVNWGSIPGRIIGRHTKGCWISEWRYIPSGYIAALHLEADAPLARRIDPPETGLSPDFQLVGSAATHPQFVDSWESRFGYGVESRLNGVCVEVSVDGTYTTPAGYVRGT